MRFVTDLSKGILGKADPVALWEQIVNRIPDSVLLKPDVTILNIACGHGTEAEVLVRRMVALGRDPVEARASIKMIDKYSPFVNYAMRRGFTDVEKADFMVWAKQNKGLKFDIVIGNPPYQGDQSGGNKTHSLWKKFIKAAFAFVRGDGHILMVTPSTWVACEKTTALFATGNFRYAEFLAPEVFKVGVDISAWHWSGGAYEVTDLVVGGEHHKVDITKPGSIPTKIINAESISIQCKVLLESMPFDIFSAPIYYAGKQKNSKYKFPIFNTNAQQLAWAEKPAQDQDTLKVMYSNCGTFAPILDTGTRGTCWHSHSIKVSSEEEGLNLIKVLTSKLYTFLNQNNRVGGFAGSVFATRPPKVDLSRTWTDAELYEYFNLTQAEIDLIERTIK